MKHLALVLFIAATLISCECTPQVPSIGGMQRPGVVSEGGGGWDITNPTSPITISTSPPDAIMTGIYFKNDGTKMYLVGISGDKVYQYSLTTAWDISTASYDSKYLSVIVQASLAFDVYFKDDGTKVYVADYGSDKIYQYSLTTAWDISTASYDSKYMETTSEDAYPYGVYFKEDGITMYVMGYGGKVVYQYSLTTAWDISTASYDNINSGTVGYGYLRDVFFSTDGTKMYVISDQDDKIYQYTLN